MKIFIDESGNTGGLTHASIQNGYSGQPFFVLAALGIDNEQQFQHALQLLLEKHRIKSIEIKSSNIYKKRPAFYSEFFELLKTNKIPLFIEFVDKKYMAVATIVNTLVLPAGVIESETRESGLIRNSFADLLSLNLPDTSFVDYLSVSTGENFLKEIYRLIESIIRIFETKPDEVSKCLVHALRMTEQEIQSEFESGELDPHKYLPPSDLNKNGKRTTVLPNLSSFANIYARINKYCGKSVSEITIIHDEQLQFDSMIIRGKEYLENLSAHNIGYVSCSTDYKFNSRAKLLFIDSKESIGVQAADLVAGFLMRAAKDALDSAPVVSEIKAAYSVLASIENEDIGIGINHVMSRLTLARLFHNLR